MATIVGTMLVVLGAYGAVGIIVGIAFVAHGVDRIDPAMHSSPKSVRLVILPGCIALWPTMLAKWARAPKSKAGHP